MTPTLGDAFPEEARNSFACQKLQPRTVCRLFIKDTNPPKVKRIVIIGINKEGKALIGYLFINSKINSTVFHSPELKSLHLQLSSKNAAYLDHDSFLDCSQIHEIELS